MFADKIANFFKLNREGCDAHNIWTIFHNNIILNVA